MFSNIYIKFTQYNFVQALFFEKYRNFVNASCSQVLEYSVSIYVAEHSHFFAHILRNGFGAAADEDIRLNTQATQFFYAVLGRFSFQFACASYEGNQGYMNVEAVVTANLFFNLADSFEEGQAFDIANSTTNFSDYEISVVFTACTPNAFFNFIGNMGNNLYSTTAIFTTTIFVQNRNIDFASGAAGSFGQVNICKTFIVTQIQVSFCTIIGYENFAMLQGVHIGGVNVQIRV